MKQMQETKGKSRKQKKGLHSWYAFRRLAAFVLSFAMVFGNVGNSAAIAMAGEAGAEVMFRMEAEDVWEAVREAVESGAAAGVPGFGEEDSAEAAKYRNLFAEGKIFNITGGVNYAAEPDVDGVGLEVFVRIADDADLENYRLTGEEELLLMYVNSSDQNVTARVAAGEFVSGKTVVKSYREAFGKTDVPTEENAEDAEEMKAGSAASGGGSSSVGTASEGADGAGTSAEGGAEASEEGGAQQGENGNHEEDGEAVGPSDDTAPSQAIDPVTENAGNEAEAGEKEEGSGELTQMPAEGAAGDKESGNAANNSSEQVTDDRGTDKAGDADKADQAEEENHGSVKPENSNNPTDEKDKENTADKEAGNAKDKDEGQDSEISVGNKSDQDGSKAEPDGNKSGQAQADRAEAGAEKDSQDKGKEKPEENKKEEAGSREESAQRKNTDGNSGDSGDSGAKDSDNSEKGGSDGAEASEKSENNDAKELSMSANRVNLVAKSIWDSNLGLVALNDGATAVVVVISLADTGFVAEDVSEEVQASAVIPAEVQAFLDAVKGIPAITPDNAEEAAEYIYGPVSEAYEVLLGTAYEEREDVQAAVAVYAAAVNAVDAAMGMESGEYKYTWIGDGYYKLSQTINAGSVTKYIGESGFYQRLPRLTNVCNNYYYYNYNYYYCGRVASEYIPAEDEYYPDTVATFDNDFLGEDNQYIGQYKERGDYCGCPCYQFDYKVIKPGTSNVKIKLCYTFNAPYDSGYCDYCGQWLSIPEDYTAYYDDITFTVKGVADYVLKLDPNGGIVPKTTYKQTAIAETTANFTLPTPTRNEYTFKGWAEEKNGSAVYNGGASVTLKWDESQVDENGNLPGSKQNPVTKTLYAVWEEDSTNPDPTSDPTTYKIVREYYINDENIATVTSGKKDGTVGDEINGAELNENNPSWKYYTIDGTRHEFTYKGCVPNPFLTLKENADSNVITLMYKKYTSDPEQTYTVIYTDGVNGEEIFPDQSYPNLEEGGETPKFKNGNEVGDPSRDGYTFKGWAPAVKDTVDPDMADSNNVITYIATWEKNASPDPEQTYTVIYTDGVNGEEVFPDQSYPNLEEGGETPKFKNGNEVGDPSRDGYTFEGWTPAVKDTVDPDMADDNNVITYTATWKKNASPDPKQTYTVIYTDGVDDEEVFPDQSYPNLEAGGETPKFKNGNEVGDPSRDGYTFKGWAPAVKDTVDPDMADGNNVITYTATWEKNASPDPKQTYTVIYTDGVDDEEIFSDQSYPNLEAGGETPKFKNGNEVGDPSRDGYTFKGWAPAVKDTVDPGMADSNNVITYTAIWEETKIPKLVVTKKNDGFKIDEKTGNAFVDYTVTITNKSGFSIYGLRLTDTLDPPMLKKVNESDIGEPNVQLTFKDFKKDVKTNDDFKDIVPEEGGKNDRVHVMQLLPRNEVFEDEQTVTLTYTIEIVNLNEDVEVEVKLDNTAKGESWSKLKDSGSARMLRSAVSSSADNDDPDIWDSATSSASGSSSSTGGILPRKYSVTYRWDNLPEGAKEVLPDGAKYFPKNIVAVDDHYQKDTEIKVEDKIYTFSGWSTDDVVVKEGCFTMPSKNVVIHGVWNEKKGETPDIPDKPDPTPSEDKANYTVEWYDADSNEQIKESETRSGTADRTVSVRESDKEVAGYTFAEDNGQNVLSAVVAEDGSTVLKLYFTKNSTPPTVPDPEPERKDTVYTVIHEYYTNGVKSGENVQTITGKKVGDTVSAADIGRSTTYNGNTYSFTSANPDSLVLEEDGDKNVITLRYDRTTSTSSNSRPSGGGGGGGGGSSATNLSGRVHGTNPEPSVTVPGDGVPLADIPEGADIPDEDVPLAGIPVADIPDADVPLSGFQGLTGIPDEDIPLASVPKTGDSSGLWHMMALLSAFSLMAVSMLDKKKRQEMKQEN